MMRFNTCGRALQRRSSGHHAAGHSWCERKKGGTFYGFDRPLGPLRPSCYLLMSQSSATFLSCERFLRLA